MITDAVLSWFFDALSALVGLFPMGGGAPNWFENSYTFLMSFSKLLPVEHFINFIPTLAASISALVVVRIVRYFLPGG